MEYCADEICVSGLMDIAFPPPPPLPFDIFDVPSNFSEAWLSGGTYEGAFIDAPFSWDDSLLGGAPAWLVEFPSALQARIDQSSGLPDGDSKEGVLSPYWAFVISACIVFVACVIAAAIVLIRCHRNGRLQSFFKYRANCSFDSTPNSSTSTRMTRSRNAQDPDWIYNTAMRFPNAKSVPSGSQDLIIANSQPQAVYGSEAELKKSGVQLKLSNEAIITGPPAVLYPIYDPVTNTSSWRPLPSLPASNAHGCRTMPSRRSMAPLAVQTHNLPFDSVNPVYEEISPDHVCRTVPKEITCNTCSNVSYPRMDPRTVTVHQQDHDTYPSQPASTNSSQTPSLSDDHGRIHSHCSDPSCNSGGIYSSELYSGDDRTSDEIMPDYDKQPNLTNYEPHVQHSGGFVNEGFPEVSPFSQNNVGMKPSRSVVASGHLGSAGMAPFNSSFHGSASAASMPAFQAQSGRQCCKRCGTLIDGNAANKPCAQCALTRALHEASAMRNMSSIPPATTGAKARRPVNDGRESGYGTAGRSRKSTPFESPLHVVSDNVGGRFNGPCNDKRSSPTGPHFAGQGTQKNANGDIRRDVTIHNSEYV